MRRSSPFVVSLGEIPRLSVRVQGTRPEPSGTDHDLARRPDLAPRRPPSVGRQLHGRHSGPVGHRQAAAGLRRLADEGRLTGRLLDAGCGTGRRAARGQSRRRRHRHRLRADRDRAGAEEASARGLTARFEVADALDVGRLGLTADTVIDSGVFHVFGDDDRGPVRRQPRDRAETRRHFLPHVLQRPAAGGLGPAPRPRERVAHSVQRRAGPSVIPLTPSTSTRNIWIFRLQDCH